jgi:hypothetical protein
MSIIEYLDSELSLLDKTIEILNKKRDTLTSYKNSIMKDDKKQKTVKVDWSPADNENLKS